MAYVKYSRYTLNEDSVIFVAEHISVCLMMTSCPTVSPVHAVCKAGGGLRCWPFVLSTTAGIRTDVEGLEGFILKLLFSAKVVLVFIFPFSLFPFQLFSLFFNAIQRFLAVQ